MMLSADEVTQIRSLVEKAEAAQGDYYPAVEREDRAGDGSNILTRKFRWGCGAKRLDSLLSF
jgi:hypothetical protein